MKKYDKIKQAAGLLVLLFMCLASFDCGESPKNTRLDKMGAKTAKLSWDRVYDGNGAEATYRVTSSSGLVHGYSAYDSARNLSSLKADVKHTFSVVAKMPNGELDTDFLTLAVATKPWHENISVPEMKDWVIDNDGVKISFEDQFGKKTVK